MSTFTISGKTIRQSNRQPIPKLYIQAWDKTTERKEALASTITDGHGAFWLRLDNNFVGELYKDQYPEIFFKVYAGNILIASTENSVVINLRGNTTDVVIAVDYQTTLPTRQVGYVVKGQILQKNFLPAAGCPIEILDKGVLTDVTIAQVTTDKAGYFESKFGREVLDKTGKQSPDIFLRVVQGKEVNYTTAVKYNAPSIIEFKEVIGGAQFPQESEFETVQKKLSPLLRNVPVADIRQDASKNPYRLLAQKTGSSEQQVKWMVMAQQVSSITQLPPAFCYALLRGQFVPEHITGASALVGADPNRIIALLQAVQKGDNIGAPFIGLAQQPEAMVKALSLLPAEAVPNAFDFSISHGVIPVQLLSQRDDLLKQWSAIVNKNRNKNKTEFEQLISLINLPKESKKLVADLFEMHNGDVHQLLHSLEEKKLSADADAKELKTAVAINDIMNDARAASTIKAKLKITEPEQVSRLASLSEKDWKQLTNNGSAAEWPEERIKQVQSALEKKYPTAAFAGKLKADPKNDFVAKEPVLHFFDAYPDVELHKTNLDSFFTKNGEVIQNKFTDSKALKSELKKIQRVFRLSPDYETTKVLMEKDINSSHHIYNLGKKNFAATVSDKLSKKEADKIYKKAERSYAAALSIVGELKSLKQGGDLSVLPNVEEVYEALAIKDFPDLKTLFASVDSWECKDCKNVYSPAAYLTDLLKYLAKRGSTTPLQSVKKILFKRRRDIGEIDLNCDNSNTAIPYLDLVCEILEDTLSTTSVILAPAIEPLLTEGNVNTGVWNEFKAKNLALDEKAAVTLNGGTTWWVRDEWHAYKIEKSGGQLKASVSKQTHGAVAERKAMPEYINYPVYDTILKNEKRPFDLPFDLSWAETRSYLNKLEIGKAAWMEAFQNKPGPSPTDAQIAAEFLNISPVERPLITVSDTANQNLYWGILAGIDTVSVFLQKSALKYTDLLLLLDVKFINPAHDSKLIHHDTTANTDNKTISNLTAIKLDRIHRFLRLWRKVGWQMWELDKVIMNLQIGNGQLNDAFLVRLKNFLQLKASLNKSVEETIAYYEDLNTKNNKSLYQSLFQNKIILNPLPDAFKLELVTQSPFPNPAPPAQPDGSIRTITAQLHSIAAVLKLKEEEAALIQTGSLANDQLSLSNISIFHRIASLTRKLRLTAKEFYDLLEVLNAGATVNVFAGPAATKKFIDTVAFIRSSKFSIPELTYLLLHKDTGAQPLIPTDEVITAFITTGRDSLKKINDELNSLTGLPDEKAKALIQKIPSVDDSISNTTIQIFNGSYTGTTVARDAFLDASYSAYIDTSVIKTKLNTRDSALPADKDQRTLDAYGAFVDLLLAYLATDLSKQAVYQLHEDQFKLVADINKAFLDSGHLPGSTNALLSFWFDPALLAEDSSGNFVNAIDATNFPNLFKSYHLLKKLVLLQAKLPISLSLLQLLISNAGNFGVLGFDELPLAPGVLNSHFFKWQNYAKLYNFSVLYPDNDVITLAAVLQKLLPVADTESNFLKALADLTLWDVTELTLLKTQLGLVYTTDYVIMDTYVRLDQCYNLLVAPDIKASQITLIINPAPVAADAVTVKQLVKSKFDNEQWLNTSANIQDVIRERKRDALSAYFLHHTVNGNTFKDADELYSYYLLDTEMSSKEITTRVLQANLSIQLFVQRCLMNLELEVVADAETDDGWLQWDWMKYYQVWAANRKVFLYPENWIEPELRLDKSPFFQELENDLSQNEVNLQNVENAYTSYLEKLDNVARLDVSGFYYEEETYTLHVFARTYDDPPIYYYRKWVEDRYWTAWEKLELEINTTQVVPVVINRRLYLYWPEFREQSIQPSSTDAPNPGQNNFPIDQPYKFWEIHLAVSELRNGKWTPKKISKTAITSTSSQDLYTDYPKENFSFLPIDLIEMAGRYLIGCYINAEPDDATNFYNSPVNFFDLGSCHGTPEVLDDYNVKKLIGNPIIPQFERSELHYLESQESVTYPNDVLAFQQGNLFINHVPILQKTPGRFRTPQSAQLSFFDKIILKIYAKYFQSINFGSDIGFPHPVGTFLPFFYEDKGRTFFVPQEIVLQKRKTTDNKPLRAELFYSDILKIIQEIFRTGTLPDILKPFFEDGQWPAVGYRLKFSNFYHPHVCFLIKQLYINGIDGMMKRDVQLLNQTKFPELAHFDFGASYSPTWLVNATDTRVVPNPVDPDTTVNPGYPKESIDFNAWGSYSEYNWELFYHAPMMVAQRLTNNQQFEEAMHWYHYIFNPTDASAFPSPQRFWNTKPFFTRANPEYISQRIDQILNMINNGDTELIKDVDDWRRNPFQPHLIAQFRTVAYQKNAVMKYLDNLIAWGDNLFRTDTRENITAATQLYILAAEILGPKQKIIPNFFEPPVLNYNQLETKLDTFSNALIDLENFIPYFASDVQDFDGGTPLPDINMFYFCLPKNEKLLTYWDTIADRLFKIRHSMNIDGIERQLALFDPPIDPALLVKAVASGLSIGAAVAGLNSPLSNYRFSVCLQKAVDFCNEVKSLGSMLLSALEKRDGEAMAMLRSAQEIRMQEAVKEVKKIQIEEAKANIEQLNKTKAVTEEKINYYSSLEYMNTGETVAFALSTASTLLDAAIAAGYLLAGGLKAVPQFIAGGSGFGGSPHVTVDIGGVQFGDAAEIATKTISAVALALDKGASLASTQGGYQRRKDEWAYQVSSGEKEIAQIDQQITAAQIRLDMAQKEYDNQQLQIDLSKETNQFMKNKFTNQQLYEWMITQISGVYFQSYQLAFDMAKRAEKSYRYELGIADTNFIQFGYWDSLKKGLLSGERLVLDLKKMDAAYYDKNKREFEITKHISLNQIDPLALLKLKQNGVCFFKFPEELFDMDYPGHYFRRVKSVAVSIPCIIGPYNNVNCTLTVLKSRIRTSADAANVDYSVDPTESDPGFSFNFSSIQQMVTSGAQNDSGMFETVLRDERYLPFEGHGAISEWKLELNKDFKNFDFNSISDVVLHVRYTARQGGAVLATKVIGDVTSHFDTIIKTQENGTGLFKMISMKADFSTEFYQLLHFAGPSQVVNFNVTQNQLPYWLSTKNIEIDNAVPATVLLKLKTGQTVNLNTLNMQVNGQAVSFTPPVVLGELKQGTTSQSGDFIATWSISSTTNSLDATKIDDIMLLVKYKIV